MPHDKYYGFQDLALLSEHVITTLFSVAPSTSASVGVGRPGIDTPPHSPVLGKEAPPPLGEFIAYALYRTRLPPAITHQALLLLSRLKSRYPSARGTATSPHRLFLSSLMLSSKISMDDTYSNKSWQVVGQGLFSLREVNQMERELFAFLGWNVVVRDEELSTFVKDVVEPYELERTAVAAPPRKSREDLKRRRDSSTSRANHLPSPAPSRSPSPSDEHRHRRASDAAAALLRGAAEAARPIARRRSRVAQDSASPSSSHPSSTSSSALTSPVSGSTTPGSPSTPISAGPLTPTHDEHHLVPAWSRDYKVSPSDKLCSEAALDNDGRIAAW